MKMVVLNTKELFVPVYFLPIVDFTVQEVCSGFESDVVNNTQEGSGEIISWQWSFPESNLNSIDTTQDSITGLFYDPECDPLLNSSLQQSYSASLIVVDEFGCR